jgi:hypothetical protein
MSPRLLRPRAAGGFNPKTIASLNGWWDANDSATITLNSGNVSQINDKSSSGFHLSQSTAARQPAYVTNSLNGKAGLNYGESGNANSLNRTISTTTLKEFVFVASRAATGNFSGYPGLMHSSQVLAGQDGSGSIYANNLFSLISINNVSYGGNSVTAAMASPFLIRTTASGAATTSSIWLGQWINNTTRGWGGVIYEAMTFGSELSASEFSSVRKYVASKWGIST